MSTPMEPSKIVGGGARLDVLVGVPASGKTTWAARWCRDSLVVTADAVRLDGAAGARVFEALHDDVERQLAAGGNATVDACGMRATQRLLWRLLAARYSARTRLVTFRGDLTTAVRRNAARPFEQRVPTRVMLDYVARWPAQLAEALAEPWDEVLDSVGVDLTVRPTRSGVW